MGSWHCEHRSPRTCMDRWMRQDALPSPDNGVSLQHGSPGAPGWPVSAEQLHPSRWARDPMGEHITPPVIGFPEPRGDPSGTWVSEPGHQHPRRWVMQSLAPAGPRSCWGPSTLPRHRLRVPQRNGLLRAASSPHAPAWVPCIARSKDSSARPKRGTLARGGGGTGMCSPVGLSPRGTLWASFPCFAGAGVLSVPGRRRCPGWCRCWRRGALCAPELSHCLQARLGLKASSVHGARGPAGPAAPLHPPEHGGTKTPL